MTPDVRVEAIVSGRLAASSRFRVLQHVAPLGRLGIEVSARPPRISKYASVPGRWARRPVVAPAARLALQSAKVAARLPGAARSWRADVTWLEREMQKTQMRRVEIAFHRLQPIALALIAQRLVRDLDREVLADFVAPQDLAHAEPYRG